MTDAEKREWFDRGATAMRDRIAAGLRAWWETARKFAGYRFPGHPHHLEVRASAVDVTTLEGRP